MVARCEDNALRVYKLRGEKLYATYTHQWPLDPPPDSGEVVMSSQSQDTLSRQGSEPKAPSEREDSCEGGPNRDKDELVGVKFVNHEDTQLLAFLMRKRFGVCFCIPFAGCMSASEPPPPRSQTPRYAPDSMGSRNSCPPPPPLRILTMCLIGLHDFLHPHMLFQFWNPKNEALETSLFYGKALAHGGEFRSFDIYADGISLYHDALLAIGFTANVIAVGVRNFAMCRRSAVFGQEFLVKDFLRGGGTPHPLPATILFWGLGGGDFLPLPP